MLSDQKGGLALAAASSEQARLIELFAVQANDGPCLDCVRTGQPVSSTDLTAEDARWPRFAPAARAAGFAATHAVPMRLRRTVIGALNLLNTHSNGVDQDSAGLGQALADVATIGMLQQRTIHDSGVLVEQLQTARAREQDTTKESQGVLVVSRGDPSPLLQTAEPAFHGVALLVDLRIEGRRSTTHRTLEPGDTRLRIPRVQQLEPQISG